MKNLKNEQPYYSSLFGMLKEVCVSCVIRMLTRKTVTTTEIRIKYVLLAMLAYVILPTTHVAKIFVEHAERIKNLDEFFVYPWGRVSFEMLISTPFQYYICFEHTLPILHIIHFQLSFPFLKDLKFCLFSILSNYLTNLSSHSSICSLHLKILPPHQQNGIDLLQSENHLCFSKYNKGSIAIFFQVLCRFVILLLKHKKY